MYRSTILKDTYVLKFNKYEVKSNYMLGKCNISSLHRQEGDCGYFVGGQRVEKAYRRADS